ncbi:protein sprint isoform X2 [Scaptodrosophila lebanonensis]|uniref:Protein sprint isoform X2 n=1 Tax=Drosophila lebanonensis TaxID=7225 RepID=A0A6J2U426_DROLE|nr:protein sprint isoform X2 [Scaptodrosophila lebanonensis]
MLQQQNQQQQQQKHQHIPFRQAQLRRTFPHRTTELSSATATSNVAAATAGVAAVDAATLAKNNSNHNTQQQLLKSQPNAASQINNIHNKNNNNNSSNRRSTNGNEIVHNVAPNSNLAAGKGNSNSSNNNNNNNNKNIAMTGGHTDALASTQTSGHSRSSSMDADIEDGDGDVVDAHGGAFEDDMLALLPKCGASHSRDELSQSRTSLVSSSEGGILAEGETSSEESSRDSSDNSPPCDLGLVERLILTHPMWFLPGIQRSGAVHLLQGKEEGTFIVRGSSQPNTMAVSVRLPPDTGPYIEHYLIQSLENVMSLESSRFKFSSIPALIAHYAQCCDELPVQLMLPRVLREANNRKKLSSLALLGQEFWSYASSPAVVGPPILGATQKTSATDQLLDAKSPLSLTETSGLGTATFFSDAPKPSNNNNNNVVSSAAPAVASTLFSPTGSSQLIGMFSQAGTPSDTNSSMSSFTTSGGQHMPLMSPNSVDSVILTMSPVVETPMGTSTPRPGFLPCNGPPAEQLPSSVINNLSTFKGNGNTISAPNSGPGKLVNSLAELNHGAMIGEVRPQRPKPPNTLNLKPPAPPLRWSKPQSPDQQLTASNNFTVTTTVTFSMDGNANNGGTQASAAANTTNPAQIVEVTTPASTNPFNSVLNGNPSTFQTFSKRLSPEGECKDTLSSQGSSNESRWQSQSSRDSNNSQRKILSPITPSGAQGLASHGGSSGKSRKSRARLESSTHYKKSDILESPQMYCGSALIDKTSDYEDVWSPSDQTRLLTSFKPAPDTLGRVHNRRPDLLAETPSTPTPTTNILSPCDDTIVHDGSQQLLQFSGDAPPRCRTGLLLPAPPNAAAGAAAAAAMTQSLTEPSCQAMESGGDGDTTPTAGQTPGSRSKQGSPFYAEPADALRQAAQGNAVVAAMAANILRQQQRNQQLPANQRHSEPLKGGLPSVPLLLPGDFEKMAGSLDELKQKQKPLAQAPTTQQQQPAKRIQNQIEHWQLDSSWEFMAKQDDATTRSGANYGDYDSTADWQEAQARGQTGPEKENSLGRDKDANKKRPLTVHQIIANRLPDLNLPELVRCSTPQQLLAQLPAPLQPLLQSNRSVSAALSSGGGASASETNGSQKSFQSQNGCRLSSYDNVERTCATSWQNYCGDIDSAQSDDGTIFSEPWESSQWDSNIQHDEMTLTSDTIHLSKCPPAVSEDDTIVEELNSTKDGSHSGSSCNQDTLKANKNGASNNKVCRPKVATILRNPSMRDREILCHPRNKINVHSAGPGDTLRAYTLQLARDPSSTFARNIENFICCTKESREAAPQVIMRNMRQFMSGMKNYLVKHGEGKFHAEMQAARTRLKADEFLNLDAILETVMHQLVVLPLREHLYGIFVDYYKRSEDIQLLAQNVKYACERDPVDFGIRPTVTPPSQSALRIIANLLWRLQEAELPLDKLELFLCVISTVFDATGCPRGQQLGADDFLPVLVYVVAKCGFVGAEIEAEFMWGLLQPTLLNGEPGYYLTALCSAVQVLKTFMSSENESGSGSLDWRAPCLPACSSVLRVIIPNECNGSLQTRTLPVRPHTTTREVCRIIAHKARITNPQDYALFKLVDGEETLLTDAECPQDVRLAAKGKHCMLAYKRIDAKIAWPTATQPSN